MWCDLHVAKDNTHGYDVLYHTITCGGTPTIVGLFCFQMKWINAKTFFWRSWMFGKMAKVGVLSHSATAHEREKVARNRWVEVLPSLPAPDPSGLYVSPSIGLQVSRHSCYNLEFLLVVMPLRLMFIFIFIFSPLEEARTPARGNFHISNWAWPRVHLYI